MESIVFYLFPHIWLPRMRVRARLAYKDSVQLVWYENWYQKMISNELMDQITNNKSSVVWSIKITNDLLFDMKNHMEMIWKLIWRMIWKVIWNLFDGSNEGSNNKKWYEMISCLMDQITVYIWKLISKDIIKLII